MKNHTLGISLISVLGVICAGLTTNAMAAGSVRALGGAGTYNGTTAAATSTRTAPARAGSLRVSPSSARLVTKTTSSAPSATPTTGTATSGTSQRLSVGKYLGAASTVSSGGTSAGSQTVNNTITEIRSDITEIQSDIADIRAHMPQDSSDGIVLVDEETGEITIDPAALMAAMNITSGTDGEDGKTPEFNYNSTTHELRWKYSDEPDSAFNGDDRLLVDVDTLMGDYLTADDLSDAIADLGGFQPKSNANYQVGNASGEWTTLTEPQIAALNSGANTTNIGQIATNTEDIATLSGTVDALTGIEGFSSGLVTNDDLDAALADYATSDALSDALSAKADKTTVESLSTTVSGKQDALNSNQLAAVNSGVTGTVVSQVAAHSNSIATLTSEVSGKADADSVYSKSDVNTLLSNKADLDDLPAAPVQSDWNETNESSLAYIANKPEIPAGVIVESSLSATSENAVQNKVIKSELDKKIPAGVIPLNNQYVLGYVNGVQMYIPIVDGEGNSGYPIIAATGEQVTE